MKSKFALVSVVLPFVLVSASALAAGDNAQGFQAARQLTSEAMGEKNEGFSGKVVEVIDVQNYTYVQFAHGKDKMWLATAKTPVKKGDLVSFADGQSMHKFYSKTLNRTFDEILFVNEIEVKR
ncbi:MAG: NrfJ-related protein [Chitinophagaceae bacterium]|nr:NrfJ-related protein [Oligoflexus sp.]